MYLLRYQGEAGQSVVASVIVLALMYAFLTFALQGAVHTKDLEANGDNALSYIAQVISGSALAKYMILAVALSALGSTLASLMGTWQITACLHRGVGALVEDRGLACRIYAFRLHGAGYLVRDRQDLAGAAGAG
jgi:amino acid transporter